MTLKEMAIKVLKDSKQPLSVTEIWKEAEKNSLISQLNINGKRPLATLSSILYTDHQKVNKTFIGIGSNPKKFSLEK